MINGNFWCSNCDCEKKPVGANFRIETEDRNEELFCPDSNSQSKLKFMGESPSGGYLRSRTLDPVQKAAFFKKRSKEDANKGFQKARREEMINKNIQTNM